MRVSSAEPGGTVLLAGRDPAAPRLAPAIRRANRLPLPPPPGDPLVAALLVEDEALLPAAVAALSAVRAGSELPVRTAPFVTAGRGRGLPAPRPVLRRASRAPRGPPELADGPPAHRGRLLERSPADVALCLRPRGPRRRRRRARALRRRGDDWAAVELGAWLAAATGEPLRLAGARGPRARCEPPARRRLAGGAAAAGSPPSRPRGSGRAGWPPRPRRRRGGGRPLAPLAPRGPGRGRRALRPRGPPCWWCIAGCGRAGSPRARPPRASPGRSGELASPAPDESAARSITS